MKQHGDRLPLVTVYMPTKNRRQLVERAANSVLNQDYPNIELIIVDDASTDNTAEWLAAFSELHANVRYFSRDVSGGPCAARNMAIREAQGEFITGLDDDDEFLPHRISSLVEAWDERYAFVCSSSVWNYGARTKVIDESACEISLEMLLHYNEASNQVLTTKERLLAVGGFDEQFIACQDYDLWTRLIVNYGSGLRIAVPSYQVNDETSSPRLIHNPRSAAGYDQFMAKHGHLMNDHHRLNQRFMKQVRTRERMTVSDLFHQLPAGRKWEKVRYFILTNVPWVAEIKQWIFRKG